MASAIVAPIGQAIVAKAEALSLTPALNGYWTSPGMEGMKVPAFVVGVPAIRRTELDGKESQLSTDDWWLEYPVEFAVNLDKSATRQAYLAEAAELFIAAIDADRALAATTLSGAQIIDSRVTDLQGAVARQDLDKPLLTIPGTVSVLVLKS